MSFGKYRPVQDCLPNNINEYHQTTKIDIGLRIERKQIKVVINKINNENQYKKLKEGIFLNYKIQKRYSELKIQRKGMSKI
jgi:hypothetical protein